MGRPRLYPDTRLLQANGINLNELGAEPQRMIKELLASKKITEYTQVAKVLNDELCEKTFRIQLDIDSLPDLNWNDG